MRVKNRISEIDFCARRGRFFRNTAEFEAVPAIRLRGWGNVYHSEVNRPATPASIPEHCVRNRAEQDMSWQIKLANNRRDVIKYR